MKNVHPLRTYREGARLTQIKLAKLLGVSRTTVARWETGLRKVDDELLHSVSAKTGIPVGELRPDLANLLRQEPAS
jgi:transcriptional regulator with XRE-family HTH domain